MTQYEPKPTIVTISYDDLEKMYLGAKWGKAEPDIVWTSANGYRYIRERFAVEEEEVDDFTEWVKDVREKAKQPKNKALRDFVEKRYPRAR